MVVSVQEVWFELCWEKKRATEREETFLVGL